MMGAHRISARWQGIDVLVSACGSRTSGRRLRRHLFRPFTCRARFDDTQHRQSASIFHGKCRRKRRRRHEALEILARSRQKKPYLALLDMRCRDDASRSPADQADRRSVTRLIILTSMGTCTRRRAQGGRLDATCETGKQSAFRLLSRCWEGLRRTRFLKRRRAASSGPPPSSQGAPRPHPARRGQHREPEMRSPS